MSLQSKIVSTSLTPGGRLAHDLAKFCRRFLRLVAEAEALLPIWILHTYVFDLFEFTPHLNIISPEPGCGKTTTGDVLSALCCRATSPMSGSAAVLRHRIASDRPTLILDEWDSLPPETRKSCINFLNTGFRQDGKYGVMAGSKIVEFHQVRQVIARPTAERHAPLAAPVDAV